MIEKLKIISLDEIFSFEVPSSGRAIELSQDIKRDGKLKNPLLVYQIEDKYLMLDDVSILNVLKSLGIMHVPVQLGETDLISVRPWQRVVENWHRDDLYEFCDKFPRQVKVEKTPKGVPSPNQVEVRFRDDAAKRLTFGSRSYLTRVDICAKFFRYIACGHRSYRAKVDFADPDIFHDFGTASAAIFPPSFSLSELAGMASRGICLPQGIVRIDQPNRVLGIDYSLSILGEKAPAREKELFLKQLLLMRISSDRVTYYDGGVFMFNN